MQEDVWENSRLEFVIVWMTLIKRISNQIVFVPHSSTYNHNWNRQNYITELKEKDSTAFFKV